MSCLLEFTEETLDPAGAGSGMGIRKASGGMKASAGSSSLSRQELREGCNGLGGREASQGAGRGKALGLKKSLYKDTLRVHSHHLQGFTTTCTISR